MKLPTSFEMVAIPFQNCTTHIKYLKLTSFLPNFLKKLKLKKIGYISNLMTMTFQCSTYHCKEQ